MVENYDVTLFNRIYKDTEALRRKLAYQIDARRFGVDYDEILSWFNVKLIYAFNKYYSKHDPDVLRGHCIKALQFFKCRILRSAYTVKYSQSIIDISELGNYENLISEEDEHSSNRDLFYNLCIEFMKEHLSKLAYQILHVQLNPPPYILDRMSELDLHNLNKIPSDLIADYFGLGTSVESINYIDELKKEIKDVTKKANQHFSHLSLG